MTYALYTLLKLKIDLRDFTARQIVSCRNFYYFSYGENNSCSTFVPKSYILFSLNTHFIQLFFIFKLNCNPCFIYNNCYSFNYNFRLVCNQLQFVARGDSLNIGQLPTKNPLIVRFWQLRAYCIPR